MSTAITVSQLATGLVLSSAGSYVLQASAAPQLPIFPTTQSWTVWFEARPCILRIDTDDVVVDLGGFELAVANDQPQGVVLIGVKAGARNISIKNGSLGRSSIGLFFGLGCQAVQAATLQIYQFAESGITAYSPQGFFLSDAVIGPNLTSLDVSQETFALQAYGAAVSNSALAAWNASPDNVAVQETSHLTGVAVVPNALGDAPSYPVANTSTSVVLQNVQVLQLEMYYREHSVRFAVAGPGVSQVAVGSYDEPLAEAYKLRLSAAKSLGVGFVPSLDCAPYARITYAYGYSLNVEDDSLAMRTLSTAWVRGVDRDGNPIRGAQAILLVGCGAGLDAPSISNVTASIASVTMLPSRVSTVAGGCQQVNKLLSTRGLAIAELPAPVVTQCCPRDNGAAGYFSKRDGVAFNVQPTSTYSAATNGSYIRF